MLYMNAIFETENHTVINEETRLDMIIGCIVFLFG
jgi:hypothetical protein